MVCVGRLGSIDNVLIIESYLISIAKHLVITAFFKSLSLTLPSLSLPLSPRDNS